MQDYQVHNAYLCLASVTAVPLRDCSVIRVLCLSVLQYLDDEEVRRVFREFVRVLCPGGTIVLHVKNVSSLYWSTLWVAKKLKTLLGWNTQAYYLRSFRWYVNELTSLDCRLLDYKSFNLLMLDFMPKRLIYFLQKLELRHQANLFLRVPLRSANA